MLVVTAYSVSAASLIYKAPEGSVDLGIDNDREDHEVDGLYRFKSLGKLRSIDASDSVSDA